MGLVFLANAAQSENTHKCTRALHREHKNEFCPAGRERARRAPRASDVMRECARPVASPAPSLRYTRALAFFYFGESSAAVKKRGGCGGELHTGGAQLFYFYWVWVLVRGGENESGNRTGGSVAHRARENKKKHRQQFSKCTKSHSGSCPTPTRSRARRRECAAGGGAALLLLPGRESERE